MAYFSYALKLSKLIFVNVIILIFIFLALEIAARGYNALISKGGFFRPNNFISQWFTTYALPPPSTKSDGETYFHHRSIPTSIDKPSNTIRIIAVGGSTTANNQPYKINQIDYPIALEEKLSNGLNKSFEVLNAGANTYSTAHSLINIEFMLVEFNPDVILLMHTLNDSSVNIYGDGATADYSNKYLLSNYLNPSLQGSLSLTGLLTQSRLLTKMGLPELLNNVNENINFNNDHSYGLYLFKRNLASIASICKMHKIKLVLLSQPLSEIRRYKIRRDTFLEYRQAVADVAKEQGVEFIDMYKHFGHDKKYFVDEVHYTPEGIDRFSNILYSELRNIISKMI
jgi:lysophospholipase L1-like esterase